MAGVEGGSQKLSSEKLDFLFLQRYDTDAGKRGEGRGWGWRRERVERVDMKSWGTLDVITRATHVVFLFPSIHVDTAGERGRA